MAHASTLEAAKNKMKKLRKQKANQRAKNAQISPEEKARLIKERYAKTLSEETNTALYDFEHHQYPPMKYGYLRNLLKAREKEILEEIKTIPDLTDEYNEIEKITFIEMRDKKLRLIINKIDIVLKEIGETNGTIKR